MVVVTFQPMMSGIEYQFFTIFHNFSQHKSYGNTRGIQDSVLVDWSPVAERSWSWSKSVKSFRKQNGWVKKDIIQGVPKNSYKQNAAGAMVLMLNHQ